MSASPASLQTKRAMFWAALAAQYAGESYVTRNRIIAALLRTESIADFCSRMHIDVSGLLDAVDDPETLSFRECQRMVTADLAEKGLELGSVEHRATVQRRSVDPSIRPVLDAVLDRHGYMAASPLELLLDVVQADATLAERLACYGLTAASIRTELAN